MDSKFGRFIHVDVIKNALLCKFGQSGSRHSNVPQLANGHVLNNDGKMQAQAAFILLTPGGGG
ncbi:hypothetical protein T11_6763 [Trichinella zimbabwensis]|uniref:Uncharacterized protein n=1 Tax=Trichinella zimbabwensis TaxID=268475 RepID=A0A0V1HFN4_9BILA|nr:hypothetical protein T11_6763 [Trichinella zimbabwensis]